MPDVGIGHNGGPPMGLPEKLVPWAVINRRYKVTHGGRGSAKSWTIAKLLILKAYQERGHLILCTREFQTSLADSVHALLKAQIESMGLRPWFNITQNEITCRLTGSRFIFKGLHHNISEIKSTEGVTICWIEEAQAVAQASWLELEPTIRTTNAHTGAGPEIWISYNPLDDDDYLHKLFVAPLDPSKPESALYAQMRKEEADIVEMNWRDNPWFPDWLDKSRRFMQGTDPDAYDWVWEGKTRKISEAAVFRGRYFVQEFEDPEGLDPYYGADFGFANDPSTLIRFFIDARNPARRRLMISHEAYGVGVELDDMPAFYSGGISQYGAGQYEGVPDASQGWPIKGDNARPETISYLANRGFNIMAAEKWPGSVEDGVAHLKGYHEIWIHPRCRFTAQEFRLYSYKVDKKTNPPSILPVIVDKHNHCIDAIRYGHDGVITRAGLETWRRLAES